MAFVNWSERMPMDSNANPNVGPGSYLGLVSTKLKFSVAPFQSKSNWNLETVNDTYTPGKYSYF